MSDPVTGIIGGVTAIGSSLLGSSASKKAADAQASAADKATATEWAMYDQTREDQTPWRSAGSAAVTELASLLGLSPAQSSIASQGGTPAESIKAMYQRYLGRDPDPSGFSNYMREYQSGIPLDVIEQRISGSKEAMNYTPTTSQTSASTDPEFGSLSRSFTMSDFTADPGYQFRMSEGLKGVQGSAAARGGLLSGGTLKALTQYGQDTASNEYGNAYNRWNNDNATRFNRLSTLAGLGQTANNTMASVGQNTANSVASNQLASGNAQASGYVGTANSINNGLGSLSSMYMLGKMFPT